jgi:N-terminal domain of galactosyltransferase
MIELAAMQGTSYIITFRESGDPARRANLEAVLRWLETLQLAEVIVVEQDVAPTLGTLRQFNGLRSVFAYNPGPFNKSWGFNIGVRHSTGSLLAFGDADIVCGSFPDAVASSRSGVMVLRPFRDMNDLDEATSALLRDDPRRMYESNFHKGPVDRTGLREHLPICGGLVIFHRQLLMLLGGWDERFLGWGGEDDAMDIKVRRAGVPFGVRDTADGFHMFHERSNTTPDQMLHHQDNLDMLRQLQILPDAALKRLSEVSWFLAGNVDRHRPMEPLR